MWKKTLIIVLLLMNGSVGYLIAQDTRKIPTIQELSTFSDSIITWMIDYGLKEIPDDSPNHGVLYLHHKFLSRGGGDCEDWAFFFANIASHSTRYKLDPQILLGRYRGSNILHAIVYFPRLGFPVDPLYWWHSPVTIVDTFIPIEDDPLRTLKEMIDNFPVEGTEADWRFAEKQGWLQ